jgi:hypothetical protein
MDGELSSSAGRRVQKHIEGCWGCRARYGQMQSAVQHFVEYRRRLLAPFLPPPAGGRARFLHKLEERVRETKVPWNSRLADHIRAVVVPNMSPLLTSVFILAAAAAALFWVWQRGPQTVSASELPDRAASWDTHLAEHGRPGVIFQKVRIRTHTGSIERTIYRDAEGRRRARVSDLDPPPGPLRTAFERGGVDWQRPLSASDFRNWRDHLKDKTDQVSTHDGISTLRTTTDSSEVKEETLSVRNTDFHPMARRLVLRDSSEIEILELNYDVLGWDVINAALLFEPEHGAPVARAARPMNKELAEVLPPLAALDEAELRARLALNQADADTSEQISVTQTRTSVVISGFVENEDRKRDLEASLRGIPLLTTTIQTFASRALEVANPARKGVAHVNEHSFVAQDSLFDTYLALRSTPPEETTEVSRQLFGAALRIQRETLALDSLRKRFPPSEREALGHGGMALLSELLANHQKSLANAIAAEKSVLDKYGPLAASPEGSAPPAKVTTEQLLAAAAQNKKLCDDVLAAETDAQRPAQEILGDMRQVLDQLQKIAQEMNRAESQPSNGGGTVH